MFDHLIQCFSYTSGTNLIYLCYQTVYNCMTNKVVLIINVKWNSARLIVRLVKLDFTNPKMVYIIPIQDMNKLFLLFQ